MIFIVSGGQPGSSFGTPDNAFPSRLLITAHNLYIVKRLKRPLRFYVHLVDTYI